MSLSLCLSQCSVTRAAQQPKDSVPKHLLSLAFLSAATSFEHKNNYLLRDSHCHDDPSILVTILVPRGSRRGGLADLPSRTPCSVKFCKYCCQLTPASSLWRALAYVAALAGSLPHQMVHFATSSCNRCDDGRPWPLNSNRACARRERHWHDFQR